MINACEKADPRLEDWEVQVLFAEADRNGDAKIDIEGKENF